MPLCKPADLAEHLSDAGHGFQRPTPHTEKGPPPPSTSAWESFLLWTEQSDLAKVIRVSEPASFYLGHGNRGSYHSLFGLIRKNFKA